METRSCLPPACTGSGQLRFAVVQPPHADQAQPEVTNFDEQPVQRGLVGEQTADDGLVFPAADLQAVEPVGPPGVQDTRHTDLIARRLAEGVSSLSRRLRFGHLPTVGAAAVPGHHPLVASEWNLGCGCLSSASDNLLVFLMA